MTVTLDKDFMESVGLGALPPAVMNRFLSYATETLQVRAGTAISRSLSTERMEEFGALDDDKDRLAFLQENHPNYNDDVELELEILKDEIRQLAPRILATEGLRPSEADDSTE